MFKNIIMVPKRVHVELIAQTFKVNINKKLDNFIFFPICSLQHKKSFSQFGVAGGIIIADKRLRGLVDDDFCTSLGRANQIDVKNR